MPASRRGLRVALVSTAALGQPGSMRAYADTLVQALARHAPEIETELIELAPTPGTGVWSQRLQTMLMPARAWLHRARTPDLWHVLDGSRAYVARGLGAAPIVVTVHDVIPWLQAYGHFPGAPALGAAARGLWRGNGRAMRSSAQLVCVSTNTARDVQRESGIEREKLLVVPLPLRPAMVDRAGTPSDVVRNDGLVLHVGNNGYYKNREGVLRIFAKLDPRIAQRLLMAGPPPGGDLLRMVHQLDLSDRIEWSNDPDDDALTNHYRRASVLLFPSLYEGFGWPVLEAMSFGLPVVASDAGSLPEVGGDAVACLPLDDEEGFVSAVEQILRSPEAAQAASVRGLARAQNFSSAAFARGMQVAYSRAIEAARGPTAR